MVYLQFVWYVQENRDKGLNIGRGNRRYPSRGRSQAGSYLKKYRDQGIFIAGCPPFEYEPAWSIIDRYYEYEFTEERGDKYMKEIANFVEYLKKEKEKAEAKTKGKKS